MADEEPSEIDRLRADFGSEWSILRMPWVWQALRMPMPYEIVTAPTAAVLRKRLEHRRCERSD
jgi:hypothetical protein